MKLAAAVVLLAASTAYAQAPGETLPEVPAPPATDSIPVMANRWAVGMSVGSLSIAPKDSPDDKTQFGIGQLSLRYRATYHLELELAVGGGQQQLDDGSQGDLDVSTALLGVRYRFAAARLAGRTFRGLLAGPQGKLWAERFELEDFPGVALLVADALGVSVDEVGFPGADA